jgi:hypothetical protein
MCLVWGCGVADLRRRLLTPQAGLCKEASAILDRGCFRLSFMVALSRVAAMKWG